MESTLLHTPIGWLKISEQDGFITEIIYTENPQQIPDGNSPLLQEAKTQLCQYFDGTRAQFDLPLKITGSEFEQKVLTQLGQVPYGQTVSYGQLAAICGHPKAARAVGTVMRKNPFVIVLPCHRVVQSGGRLGSYSAGGVANKEWLLTFEGQNSTGGIFGNAILSAFFGL